MGDMADLLIEQGLLAMLDGIEEDEGPFERECSYCGQGGLHWRECAEGWRLFDEQGVKHECKEYWRVRARRFRPRKP